MNTQENNYARSLIEASLDPIVTISAIGKITDVNEASVKVTGILRDKLIGTNFSNYFTDPEKAQAGYELVFKDGEVKDYPLTIKHKGGNLTDVLYNASIYKDTNGKVLGVFASARDVTDQKWAIDLRHANKELSLQNKEKEERAAELIVANKELAFQNDEKEKRAAELIIANKELAFQNEEKEKRASELTVANKELAFQNDEKEKRAAELIIANKELAFQNNEKEKRALELTTANKELAFQNNEKEKRAAELIVANKELVFQNGEKEKRASELLIANEKLLFETGEKAKRAAELVIADKEKDYQTKEKEKQKLVEKELTEAKVFAELASEFADEAKIKAESATAVANDAVKAKQQFLSNMSHEIRTPMNAIIGFTKVLLKTELSSKQEEYLNAIKVSGDALIVLINDILDLAKVDAGKMDFEQIPFKLAASISSMLHLFGPKIQEKNLLLLTTYDKKIPEVLVGDPVRLHQIILNLVSNAVKFTSEGNISVDVKLISEDEIQASVEFSVSDTGIGIPENKIEKIFENFQQASSGTSRLYGGTGLGLAIVKQLVSSQNGSVTVNSKQDVGSTFSFILSFSKTKAAADEEIENILVDPDLKNIKVLIVEDIPLNQLLMKTLLDEYGFERDVAANGKIAIEKFRNKSFDIILMDLQMPEMNGFEATDYIRNTLNSKIPIIALTADVTTVDLAKCKAVGMNDYIAKPVDDRLLYTKIVSLVKKTPNNLDSDKLIKVITAAELKSKYIDLSYLNKRTKSNPTLMMEMIGLYLEQTPPLITSMKQSLLDEDWESLHSAVHKMIPSFSIMGIHSDFETKAKQIQEFAVIKKQSAGIQDLVGELELVCLEACKELEEEFKRIKNMTL